jgi:ribonuclease-3
MGAAAGDAGPTAAGANIGEILGVDIPADLLLLALTHRSYAYEHGGLPTNERLEFLGDAVLEMVVTDTLYRRYPDRAEGDLAKMRASVVSARSCAQAARAIGLGPHLLLGRGEITTGGQDKTSILSDAMEAVLGAVYIGCGLEAATEVIMALFGPKILASAELGAGLDWKTSLQELTARLALGVPEYAYTAEGPDHSKHFTVSVVLQKQAYGQGVGRTKKEAEMQAAENTYRQLSTGSSQLGAPEMPGA